MKQIHRLLLIILLGLTTLMPTLLHAQAGSYTPTSLIIPGHSAGNQLHVSLGVGGGYNANISYAVTNHIAVFTTGTFHNGTARKISFMADRFNIKRDDYAVTGGVGYFSNRDRKKITSFETYIGTGTFKIDNYRYFVNSRYPNRIFLQANYWNLFWQLNAGRKTGRYELVYALRLAYSNYNNYLFYEMNQDNKTRYKNVWGLTIDPVLSYGYVWREFKFNVQAGLSFPLTGVPVKQYRVNSAQEETLITHRYSKFGLFSLLGRLSIERNFNFSRKTSSK